MPAVSFDMTLSGTVADFDVDAFRTNFSRLLGTSPANVLVSTDSVPQASSSRRRLQATNSTGAGTFSINVVVIAASAEEVDSLTLTLSGYTPMSLSASLGVTVTSVSAPTATTTVVTSASPPPSQIVLDSTASAQTAGTDEATDNSGAIVGAVLGVVCAILLVVAIGFGLKYRMAKAKPTSTTVVAKAVVANTTPAGVQQLRVESTSATAAPHNVEVEMKTDIEDVTKI